MISPTSQKIVVNTARYSMLAKPIGADRLLDHLLEHRIMCATEHERIDMLRAQLREIFFGDERCRRMIGPALFGKRHEERTGRRKRLAMLALLPRDFLDRDFIRFA